MDALEALSGYALHEYLLVIRPSPDVFDKVMKLKKAFAKEFDAKLAAATEPQVSLVKFFAVEMKESKIITRLQSIAAGVKPFAVELKDFGSLPTHSIHVNVRTRVQINELTRDLKTAQSLLKHTNEFKPNFIDEPHITICHKLKPWQYEAAWLRHQHEHFTARFMAEDLRLLKRPAGEKYFNQYRVFSFRGIRNRVEQTQLF